MQYDFDRLPDRLATESAKWHRFPPDVLPMWVADMDFPSPEPVVRALRQRVEHGVFGYPEGLHGEPNELMELRKSIVEWVAQRYHWQIQSQDLVFTPGVVIAFDMAAHAFAVPGGGILCQTPVYDPIWHSASWTGARSQETPLIEQPDGRYTIDAGAFEQALTPGTRVFLLCNPHNPVGRVFSRGELEQMAEACLRRGVLICSDEIHADLVYRGEQHVPIASIDPEIADRTITLMAPSKTFNIAGLQFSYAIITNPDLRETYRKANMGLVGWVNLMGVTAALAAYREGHEWFEQLLVYLEANRDLVHQFVRENLPGVRMALPQATYLAWLDCRQAAHPEVAAKPYRFFLKEARVGLSDGRKYGQGGEGFVRLNFGCPRPMLLEALQRMQAASQVLGD